MANTYVFSVNNRFVGTGGFNNPYTPIGGTAGFIPECNSNASEAWFTFKNFMVNTAGWTVTYSGFAFGPDNDFAFINSDIINSSRLMDFNSVFFVLQSPDSQKELLFYRAPTNNVNNIPYNPYDAIPGTSKKKVYISPRRDLSAFIANPVFPQIGSGTGGTVGTVASSTIITNLGSEVDSSCIGRYLYVNDTNIKGTFLITAYNGINSITISDYSGSTLVAGAFTTDYQILPTNFMRGFFASIGGNGQLATISGLTNMTIDSVGHMLKLSDATNSNNNGEFIIVNYINSTTVQCFNPYGFTLESTSAISWDEIFQISEFLGEDSSRMSIGYSAQAGFTSVGIYSENFNPQVGSGISSPLIGYLPAPNAIDLVWLTKNDLNLTTGQFPPPGGGNSFAQNVQQFTQWNVHMCAATTDAPVKYGFYLWWTSSFDATDYIAAPKTQNPFNNNIPNLGTVTYPFDSMAFLAMDPLLDAHPSDTDPYTFWCDTDLGAPNRMVLNYPQTVGSMSTLVAGNTGADGSSIKSWYLKPSSFTTQQNFINSINSFSSGFLTTAVLMYQIHDTGATSSGYDDLTMIPGSMPTDLLTGNDFGYPLMYGRGSSIYASGSMYVPGTPTTFTQKQVYEPFRLPPAYKGASSMFYLSGTTRDQFNTINVGGALRSYICCGRFAQLIIPWDGTISTPGSIPNMA